MSKLRSSLWWIPVVILIMVGCQPSAQMTPTVVSSPTSPPAARTSEGKTLPVTASDVPRIKPEDLKSLLASARNIIVVDVRGHEAYAAGHVPGALDIPYADVEAASQQLPKDTKIVFYCA
ncbi:MAG: rhodanese-like domain-containing protein [Anaerolineae bacterium]|nr:rhodanese-like domain-containing protein [Anaerolineae bacterium]